MTVKFILHEIVRVKVDILGIAEARWTQNERVHKDRYTMLYSGEQSHRNGVGILLNDTVTKSIVGY